MTLFEVADEIHRRLAGIFLRNANVQRPVYGGTRKFQEDSHWRDLLLFYEYFHGDNGASLEAGHQMRWTGTIAVAMDIFNRFDAKRVLETQLERLQTRLVMEPVGGEGAEEIPGGAVGRRGRIAAGLGCNQKLTSSRNRSQNGRRYVGCEKCWRALN